MKAPADVIARRLKTIRSKEEEERAKREAAARGFEYLDLRVWPADREALASLPEPQARKARAVVIRKIGKTIWLGAADFTNTHTAKLVENLKKQGRRLTFVLLSPASLKRALAIYKELPAAEVAAITGGVNVDEARVQGFSKKIQSLDQLKTALPETFGGVTSSLLELLLAAGLNLEASDIHFEMTGQAALARVRIDGILHDVQELPDQTARALVRRLKLLAGMKLNVTTKPQDGRFSFVFGESAIELRASVIPGEYGEDAVLRLLDPRTIALDLGDLGVRPDLLEQILGAVREPQGMIVTTGPTGSGKTTALYAFVRKVASPEIKVITIEDPIEYHLEAITQTQVDQARGYTFAAALRSALRQDPDVILVGEIRDRETAETALAAALTGHLVFSTLHTNDAVGAVPRLVDLGVKPETIAPALSLVLAQRLTRRLCQHCRVSYRPEDRELALLKKDLAGVPAALLGDRLSAVPTLFRARGCKMCLDGYKGRIAIFEGFFVNETIQRLILKAPPQPELREAALKAGMVPLRQDGLLRVLDGITTLEEVQRVVGRAEV